MRKNKECDFDSASFGGISGLPERRLAVYREMLRLVGDRETALTSDQFSEIASIAARKAEPAAEAALVSENPDVAEGLRGERNGRGSGQEYRMSTFRIIA